MTTQLTTGLRVVRLSGAPYHVGDRGTVVETSESTGRVRVLWDTRADGSPRKAVRTWVQIKVVRPEEPS